ncbi:PaaI family thioesterase [Balneolaceae bacterium ANBcel3]|nr:PaaI family thioesterase [Balneolaceae bacterium ANBcel3]
MNAGKNIKIDKSLKERWEMFFSQRKEGLTDHLGISVTQIEKGSVRGVMPVTQKACQPFGLLHGGASVTFAETLASFGSWILLSSPRARASAVEINANHIKPVSKGQLEAEATLVHQGKRIHVWTIQIKNAEGHLVCTSRCTVSVNDEAN